MIYDRKFLASRLFVLCVVVGAMYATGGIGFALVAPLMLVAMLRGKREDLLFYLVMIGTMVVGNANVMPKTTWFFVLQRSLMLVLAAALSVRVFGRRHPPEQKPLLFLFVYLGYMAVISAAGWCPFVSYLKLMLFVLCFTAYYAVSADIVMSRRAGEEKVRSVMLAIAAFYIFGSIALIPFPAMSQLSGEAYVEAVKSGQSVTSLFTGMTNQSQCLGPCVAALATLLLGDLVFGVKRASKLHLALLACVPALVYKTSSRTALGTLAIGVLTVLFLFAHARGVGVRWRSKVVRTAVLAGFAACVAAVALPGVRQGAMKFLVKWGDDVRAEDLTMEGITMSRQGKMEESLFYFRQSPLVGNGFQVSESMKDMSLSESGLVLSAPIEKGVWVTAVLEEGGIIGALLFWAFVFVAVGGMVRAKAYVGASVLVTFLTSNLGEFAFFSMSYIGGFIWAMLFLALILDEFRNRRQGGGGVSSQRSFPFATSWHSSIPRQ